MTPMIDVVFLLIIFFLVSSHLAKQESQMELELPVASTGQDDVDLETPRLTINVKADGTMMLAGRTITKQQLKSRFAEARSKEGNNIEVRIRGSRMTQYADVEPIMLACTAAKIFKVTFAVYRENQ